jgi:hypothetical protein
MVLFTSLQARITAPADENPDSGTLVRHFENAVTCSPSNGSDRHSVGPEGTVDSSRLFIAGKVENAAGGFVFSRPFGTTSMNEGAIYPGTPAINQPATFGRPCGAGLLSENLAEIHLRSGSPKS